MSEIVDPVSTETVIPVKTKVKVSVHPNCTTPDGNFTKCEYLVYLTVPAAGGDGLLIGVTETELAAETIASALNSLLGFVHTHA